MGCLLTHAILKIERLTDIWSHGDFPICGKIKDTQRSEMATLDNYGTRRKDVKRRKESVLGLV